MKKRLLIGAVAVASGLALAGCGSAPDHTSSQGTTDQSATLTRATFASALSRSTSSVSSVRMVGSFTSSGQHVTLTANLSEDPAAKNPRLPVKQILHHVAMSMSMSLGSGRSAEMRLVNGAIYVNASQLGLGQTPKPWIKFDLDDPNNPVGAAFGQLSSLSPSQLTREFRALVTLHNEGAKVVDGVATTHYVATIDTAKVASIMGLDGTESSSLPKTLTYNVWIDSSSRPVEIAMNIAGTRMQMHFSHWNEPVHVVAPPASQVTSASQ
jgi:hypothetical protein